MTGSVTALAHETWLSVQEASAMLGVSPATLRRWSAAGEVEAFTTPGGHRRFSLSTLTALLQQGTGDVARSAGADPETAAAAEPPAMGVHAGVPLAEVVAVFVRFRALFVDELADACVRHGLSSAEATSLVNRGGAAADRALAALVTSWEEPVDA